MKKLIVMMMLAMAMTASMTSCSSQTDEPTPTPEEVSVKLDYALFEQGSMSRSGESLYDSFYNSYIKTKQIAPKTYNLQFRNENGAVIAEMVGAWDNDDAIRLLEGKYRVSGDSEPKAASTIGKVASDSLTLMFKEEVNISKATTTLTLKAQYDCFLLLFDASSISNIKIEKSAYGSTECAKTEDNGLYYIFITDKTGLSLQIKRTNNALISIDLNTLAFEKGKYYYFSDLTNSFDIDPMESGN